MRSWSRGCSASAPYRAPPPWRSQSEDVSPPPPPPTQSQLPLEIEEASTDEDPALFVPALDRPDLEHAALAGILEAAELAMKDDRKVSAIARLLRRIQEPAIVFTEYRDTLATVMQAVHGFRRVVCLHGGLVHGERREVVAAFTNGAADLLLATDAGSEGLNLQGRCRLAINLELPWNPIRLEQRIGRVDRIGQSRAVHAINLYAAETAESTVLANLFRRLDRIRASEISIASCVIDGGDLKLSPTEPPADEYAVTVHLETQAREEAARIIAERAASKATAAQPMAGAIPVTLVRSRRSAIENPAVIWFMRARIFNGAGRLVEDSLVPLVLPRPADSLRRPRDVRSYIEDLMTGIAPALTALVERHLAPRVATIASLSSEGLALTLVRERQITGATIETGALFQAGLFDRRAIRRGEASARQRRRATEEGAARIRMLESGATASLAQPPEIALVLVTC